jgi:hypothetical protein
VEIKMYRVNAFTTNHVGETIFKVKEEFTDDQYEEALDLYIETKKKYSDKYYCNLVQIESGHVVAMIQE